MTFSHEVGLETLDVFRGRGYAGAVVAGWAMAVRKIGRAVISASWENLSSQSVVRKLALSFYGVNFTLDLIFVFVSLTQQQSLFQKAL
jgi:hypothetical protein